MNKLERNIALAQKVHNDFEKNIRYKESLNIIQDAEKAVNFYEGKMYKTNNEKPFEKPKFNMVKFHIDGKQSNILAKTWKFNFVVNNNMLSTKKVSKFTDFQLKEMNFKSFVKRAVKDGLLKGTYCFYFYWDENSIGELGTIKGGLKCDVIDFNDIAVANPAIKDIQQQEWIIIRSREKVKAVKEMCNTLTLEDKEIYIKSNTKEKTYDQHKEQDDDMITVYMKFFKQDGEVYFQSFTNQVTLTNPTALNPKINEKKIKYKIEKEKKVKDIEEDVNNSIDQETNEKTPDFSAKFKANMYPLELGSFNDREKCIYGISDVIDIIPNNKLVNRLMTMNALYSMKTVLNTLIAKQGALGNQIIDPTKVGQIITDYSPVGEQGFYTVSQPSIPTQFFELANGFFDFTTTISRTKELVTAETIQKDLSGVAMQQVVAEQNKPVQQQQDALWTSFEKIGKILEMFYKLFYHNTQFTYVADDADRQLELENNNLPDYEQTTLLRQDTFNGEDYLDTPFTVQVEVGEGSRYSELMTQQVLNDFYKSGTYSNLTVDQKIQYFTMMDRAMFTKKDEMIRLLQQEKNGIIQQQQAVIEQQQKQIDQQAINMKAMYEEFGSKINIYNGELEKLRKEANFNKKSVANNL